MAVFPSYRLPTFSSPHWALLLLLFFFSRVKIVLSTGCYYGYNTTVLSSPDYVDPCGSINSTTSIFLNCCALQSNNLCLSSSICYDPNPVGGAYYLSPCTDKTYQAPECPQYCSNRVDKNQLDITYDTENQIWRCCSTSEDGSSDCSHPTDETFSAPPPSSLSTIYPIIRTASASSSTFSSSPPPSSSPSVSKSEPSSFSPLSPLYSPSPHSSSPSSETEIPTSSPARGASSTSTSTSTTTTSSPVNSSGSGGLGTSNKVALGIGIPGTLATIAGAYFAYAALRRRSREQKQKQMQRNADGRTRIRG